MTDTLAPLPYDEIYHLFNYGVGHRDICIADRDYQIFLEKYKRFLSPVVETYAYTLLPNYFHFLLKIKNEDKIMENRTGLSGPVWLKKLSQHFSNFFNSYSKSFNRVLGKKGNLFDLPFKRILVDGEIYFKTLVYLKIRSTIHIMSYSRTNQLSLRSRRY